MSKQREPESPGADGFRCGEVAVVGRPNVGKSTLVNALVGARISITSKRPQTTRHRIRGILTTSAAQFIFVDTPGFQTEHKSALNARMNRMVREGMAGVDAIVLVVEPPAIGRADRDVVALLPAERPVIIAVNKVDRVADKSALLPLIAEMASLRDFAAIVPISAEKRWLLDDLIAEMAKLLPVGPALYPADDMTDRDERFLAAEFIREKIFRRLGKEVPYATTVTVDRFVQEGKLRRIEAKVLVQKASQRAILLGEGGERMKEIASAARRDMERLFGGKVFLEVRVRVAPGWASDERELDRLGY
jgi:GTP-binding protein Era